MQLRDNYFFQKMDKKRTKSNFPFDTYYQYDFTCLFFCYSRNQRLMSSIFLASLLLIIYKEGTNWE